MAETAPLVFTSAPRGKGDPVPVTLTMRDKDDKEVTETFLARPAKSVSLGALVGASDEAERGEVLAVFRELLVEDNSDPDDPEDDRSEYDRFVDYVTDPDLFIDDRTLLAVMEGLQGLHAEVPTPRTSGSGRTGANARRGSTARRRR